MTIRDLLLRACRERAEEFEKTSTGKVKRYLYAVESAEV